MSLGMKTPSTIEGLRVGICLAALTAAAWSAGAAAQTASGTDPAAAQSAEAAPSGNSVEEIVVTAERRPETLQKSSIALQVVTSEELERSNLTQATDLNNLVPGLQIGTGGSSAQIYIRGVGDFAASALSN